MMTVVLTAKTRRGKNSSPQKHFHKNFQKSKYKGNFQGKVFDMSRIKCFIYNKMGHCRKAFVKGSTMQKEDQVRRQVNLLRERRTEKNTTWCPLFLVIETRD
jgi:hypothetical protein